MTLRTTGLLSGLSDQQLCQSLRQVSASNLSFKIITIRKLGPSKPSQVLTLFCCREMSYWVSLSGESGKRPVELKRKEHQGPCAPSSSHCGHKCVCRNTLRETSTFLCTWEVQKCLLTSPTHGGSRPTKHFTHIMRQSREKFSGFTDVDLHQFPCKML